MRKSLLVTVAAMTVAVLANSAIIVQAKTQNLKGKLFQTNVVSESNANCREELDNILLNLKANMENIIWGNCFTMIHSIINASENDSWCTNNPEINIPEINNPETDIPEINNPETGAPEANNPETDIPEVNEPETSIPEEGTTVVPETETPGINIPEVDIPETTRPNTDETTTEATSKPAEENQNKTYAEQVVDLVNKERAKAGLKKLTLDKNIETAALVRAKEIEVSFSHTRPNGSSFSSVLREYNISYYGAGENIAWGQATPEAVMNAWMNSEGHRANILNAKFTKIGVGYYQNSAGRKYWTQLFTY